MEVSGFAPAKVYALYCQRGEAPENRIKEFKVDLATNRLSCQDFRANRFRLILHGAAYMLIQTMQEALAGTAEGGRNDRLNQAAFAMGQLEIDGGIDGEMAGRALRHVVRDEQDRPPVDGNRERPEKPNLDRRPAATLPRVG